MFHKLLLSALVLTAGAKGAYAQGFTGAEIGLEYTDAPDVDDLGGISYHGSGEFFLGYGVSVAVDASAYNYDVGIADVSNLTAHVMYSVDAATAIGGFFGQDNAGDLNTRIYGAEVAYDFGLGDVQGYLGRGGDITGEDATLYGASASYELANGISLEGGLDGYTNDDLSARAFEVGGSYQLQQGPRFGAAIGSLSTEAGGVDASDMYFALRASVAIGPNGGTTFDRRGAFAVNKIGLD